MRSIERDNDKYDGAFHWLEGGPPDAPTLVLVHGHMAHAIAYRYVWPRLNKHFRLIIPDLPGHGRDETFRGLQMQPRTKVLADWLCDLLDASCEGPAHIVGHSLGASLAYEIALHEPSRFCSMTLASPGFCVSAPPGATTFLDYLPPKLARIAMNRVGVRLIEPFRWKGEPMSSEEAEAYIAPFKDVDRLEFALRLGADLVREACDLDELEVVDVPTQLIFGEDDDFVEVDSAEQIAERLRAIQSVVLSDCGHSPPEDAAADFNDLVVEFARAHECR